MCNSRNCETSAPNLLGTPPSPPHPPSSPPRRVPYYPAMSKKKSSKTEPTLIARWRLTRMSNWDNDFMDAEVPAFIEFKKGGDGEFHFGYVNCGVGWQGEARGSLPGGGARRSRSRGTTRWSRPTAAAGPRCNRMGRSRGICISIGGTIRRSGRSRRRGDEPARLRLR